jgi:SPP1 gp7 family putative phage head morphogenesis protein
VSANQILLDEAFRHKLFIEKYERGLANKIVRLLNSADQDIRAKLGARLVAIEERGYDLGPSSTKRLQDLLTEVSALNSAVYQKAGAGLKIELTDLAAYEIKGAAEGLSDAIGIGVNVPPAQYLKTLVERSPIGGRVLDAWTSKQATDRQEGMAQAIRIGLLEGENTDAIVNRIFGTKADLYTSGVFGTSRRNAQTFVLTAASTVSNNAREEVYKRNSHLIRALKWVSTLDTRTTTICQSRDGNIYPIGEPHPAIGAHPRCRSILAPITRKFDEKGVPEIPAGKRASMDGQVPKGTTFGDWIEKQSPERQNAVFGPERAQLFRDGKVKFPDLYKENGEFRSLDELRKAEAKPTAKADPKPAPEPKPKAPTKPGYIQPRNADVTDATIVVEPRQTVAKKLTPNFAQAAADSRYMEANEFRGRKPADWGRAALGTGITDEAASTLAAIFPELDALADAFALPRLRGVKSLTGSRAVMDMGDGVLGVNPQYINSFASGVGNAGDTLAIRAAELQAKADKLREEIRAIQAKMDAIAVGDTPLGDEYYNLAVDKRKLRDEWISIDKKAFKAKSQAKRGIDHQASEWKPGDDVKTRPFTVDRYFSGIDRMRTIMFHEFGHHVHQMWAKKGSRRAFGPPPLEAINLRSIKRAHALDPAKIAATRSTYAFENASEYWAENFALYMMGKKDWVDPEIVKLIEELLDEARGN